MKILTMDIGGTAIKSALMEESGILVDIREKSSSLQSVQQLLNKVVAVAKAYQEYDIVAVSMTGQIDCKTQTLLSWSDGERMRSIAFPVGEYLSAAIEKPVFMINDANAAALGEKVYGAGKSYKNFLCLTYGTGVGGGIVQNGSLLTGARGIAGELGHMTLHAGGLQCRCGNQGCYQQYASVTALVREARKCDPRIQNARELFDKLVDMPQLQKTVDDWIEQIVRGLCSLAYIFDPECFILGGGVMERLDVLQAVEEQFKKQVMDSFSGIKILPAALGNQAGMLGAASFAMEMINQGDNKYE